MTASIRSPRSPVTSASASGSQQPGEADDGVALADRDEERHHPVAEGVLRLGEQALVVGAGLVELGDHDGARHADARALPPQRAGAVVDALVGGDHEERAVGGAQSGAQLTDEVGVPGSVDQVDLGALVDQRRDGEGDGPTVGVLGSS